MEIRCHRSASRNASRTPDSHFGVRFGSLGAGQMRKGIVSHTASYQEKLGVGKKPNGWVHSSGGRKEAFPTSYQAN